MKPPVDTVRSSMPASPAEPKNSLWAYLLYSFIVIVPLCLGCYYVNSVSIQLLTCDARILVLESQIELLAEDLKSSKQQPLECSHDDTADYDISSGKLDDHQKDEYGLLSSRIDRLYYLIDSSTTSTASTSNFNTLSARVDVLSSQYSALLMTQGSNSNDRVGDDGATNTQQLLNQYKTLKEEVYQLHSFLVKEVENLVNSRMEDTLSLKDRQYEKLLNKQLSTMDEYIVGKLNIESELVGRQLSDYVNTQTSKLEKSLIDEMNTQLSAMNDYVVSVVAQQVLALEEHFRKVLVDLLAQHVERVDKLENRIVRWSLMLHNDGTYT